MPHETRDWYAHGMRKDYQIKVSADNCSQKSKKLIKVNSQSDYACPMCGLARGKRNHHDKCSKIVQKKHQEERAAKGKME